MKVKKNKVIGFSLIELMVVIAIVAVLAAVAIPSYSQYMFKSRIHSTVPIMFAIMDKAIEYSYSHPGENNATTLGLNGSGQLNPVNFTFNTGNSSLGNATSSFLYFCANRGILHVFYTDGHPMMQGATGVGANLEIHCRWYTINGAVEKQCSYALNGTNGLVGGDQIPGFINQYTGSGFTLTAEYAAFNSADPNTCE